MIRINLLEIREERRRIALHRLITVAASVWLSTLTLLYVAQADLMRDISLLKTGIHDTDAKTAELEKIVGEIEKIRGQKADLEKKLDVIRNLEANRAEIVDLLLAVSEVIGDEIWIDKIKVANESIAMDANSIDMQSIGLLLQRLKADPRFANPSTKNIAVSSGGGGENSGAVKFQLEVTFVPPQAPKPKAG